MDIYQRIQQIKAQIAAYQAQLADLRQRKQQTQDEAVRQVLQANIEQIIDAIDRSQARLEKEESYLPETRTNGHHPPESEEDAQLPLDPNVPEDTDPSTDN